MFSSPGSEFAQILASRDELAGAIAALAPEAGDAIYVHPLRRSGMRGLLLEPRSGFVVSLISERPRAAGTMALLRESELAHATKRLADPHDVFAPLPVR